MDTGGVLGMAAKSVMVSRLCIIDAITKSVITTTTMIGSICVGEKNQNEINELLRYVFCRVIPYQILFIILEVVITEPICSIFSTDIETINLATSACRFYYTSVIFETICNILLSFYIIFEYQKFVNTINIFHSILIHVIYAILFKNIFGMYSVFSGYTVTELVTLLVIIIYTCIKNKHFPKTFTELVLVGDSFNSTIKLNKTIKEYTEITTISNEVTQFCLSNNINSRFANLAGLCTEEMCANIFEHGFTKKEVIKSKVLFAKDICAGKLSAGGIASLEKVDIFVIIENDELTIRIRDNAIAFNPTTRSIVFNPEDPCKNVGLRLVNKISKEMTYQNIFGFNNMIIKL